MRIVVWTPTCRPGLDVAHGSIMRQNLYDNIYWIVGDDRDRELEIADHVFTPRKLTSARFCLDTAHNVALTHARELDADLFVFLMDYTWIPDDGVERFADMAIRHPHSILTGIAHTSLDPSADLIVNPNGAYTIFAEPYYDQPEYIGWEDVRTDRAYKYVRETSNAPIRWEGNWAAFPRQALHDSRLNFDEKYDEFHGHDNIDLATRAAVHGYEIWIDYDNAAIRLPRRTYWPEEEGRFKDAEDAGMRYFWSQNHHNCMRITTTELDRLTGFYREVYVEGDETPGMFEHVLAHLHPTGEFRFKTNTGDQSSLTMSAIKAGFGRVKVDPLYGAFQGQFELRAARCV